MVSVFFDNGECPRFCVIWFSFHAAAVTQALALGNAETDKSWILIDTLSFLTVLKTYLTDLRFCTMHSLRHIDMHSVVSIVKELFSVLLNLQR